MPTLNWQINVMDIVAVVGAAMLLYGRIVSLETKIEPIWKWWNGVRRKTGEDT